MGTDSLFQSEEDLHLGFDLRFAPHVHLLFDADLQNLSQGNFPVLTRLWACTRRSDPLHFAGMGCAWDVDELWFWTAREPRGERADHLR